MKVVRKIQSVFCPLLVLLLLAVSLSACGFGNNTGTGSSMDPSSGEPDTANYIYTIEDEPDTVDFQCTTIYYTIATNVFNRLVETESDKEGNILIIPSLAKSWEISDDGLVYTFHLREGVTFSNGSPLTSSDVLYTFTRLLTYPDSCNQDIAAVIAGAAALENGETDTLAGFEILSDLDFKITLAEPYAAFLACMSMPGASILDEETTKAAGKRFGYEAAYTIGTGSYILSEWEPGKGILLTANKSCWDGPPNNEGVMMYFMTDPEEITILFDEGGLDILNLEDVGNSSEFYLHGDIYQDRFLRVRRVAIAYIALNEMIYPLNDVRVRKALQMGLNRQLLLDTVYNGEGDVENGIYPHGLYGYNPDIPEIPYDPEAARELLAEAGLENGFNMTISVRSSSTTYELTLMRLAASMWEKIGVHASIEVMDESTFMRLRKSGELACYTASWMADYDDPENFIYTFFGNRANTAYRSICYQNDAVMQRVSAARTITDPDARIKEYRDLEQIIVQEDAAWIPLLSRNYIYVTSERADGFRAAWNGSVKNMYRYAYIKETP